MASSTTGKAATLADRFRQVMDHARQVEDESDFTQLTLQELGKSTISFGEAKKGMTYESVLQTDQSYVAWFTNNVLQQPEVSASSIPVLHPEVCRAGRDHARIDTTQEQSQAESSSSGDSSMPSRRGGDSGDVRRRELHVGHHRGSATADQSTGEQPECPHRKSGSGTWAAARPDLPSEGCHRSIDNSISSQAKASEKPALSCSHDSPIHREPIDVDFVHDDNWVFEEMWTYWSKKHGLSDPAAVQRHFSSPGIDLLEVYCDQESQLTKQATGEGLAAARFGLRQGDLSTTKGRFALYDMLWSLRPKHIWCAPKCSPWCGWSRLNRNKSIALAAKIDASRRDENVHLLLCDAMLRLQVWRSVDTHFHLEQPQGSELIHHMR
eukprot:s1727_g26.t1